jgi:membrane-bound metal-dependent hydrolase YbcI (DUF457 family)
VRLETACSARDFFEWRFGAVLAVDIPTHALASLALARGFFPKRRWPIAVGMVFAGTLADIDLVSALFGPADYLTGHRTFTHSAPGTIAVAVLAALFTRYLSRKQPESWRVVLFAVACAATLHPLLDLGQSEGVALLWPFRRTRFAEDWLPTIDPWLLAALIAGILVPELFLLVTSEIGAKSRSPRGRNGALAAFVLMLIYLATRAILHSNSTALLEARTYHGESARKVGAFPDALSLVTWHGLAETESLICLLEVPTDSTKFDPEAASCMHKPESSPELDAAQQTAIAQTYLQVARFPRAVVAKTQDGFEVVLRSMVDQAQNETRYRVAAMISLTPQHAVTGQTLVWLNDVHLR